MVAQQGIACFVCHLWWQAWNGDALRIGYDFQSFASKSKDETMAFPYLLILLFILGMAALAIALKWICLAVLSPIAVIAWLICVLPIEIWAMFTGTFLLTSMFLNCCRYT